jgi:hypothetical protein
MGENSQKSIQQTAIPQTEQNPAETAALRYSVF